MPRVLPNDPNNRAQRPSQREANYGPYKILNELVNEIPFEPKASTPNIQRFTGAPGTTQFGRSNITLQGKSGWTQLANLMDVGIKGAGQVVSSAVAVGQIEDRSLTSEMQDRLGELDPNMNPDEYAQRQKAIFEEYEEKFNLLRAKEATKERINSLTRDIPKLTDEQNEVRLQETLAKIEETIVDPVDKQTAIIKAYEDFANKAFMPRNKQLLLANKRREQVKLKPIQFEDVSQDYLIARNEILVADYKGDIEAQVNDLNKLNNQYKDEFEQYFGTNEEDPIVKKYRLLLLGFESKNLDYLESETNKVTAAAAKTERDNRILANELLEDWNAQQAEGNLLQQYEAEILRNASDESVTDSYAGLSVDPNERVDDFIQWLDKKGVNFPLDDPQIRTEVADILADDLRKMGIEINSRLAEGLRQKVNLKFRDSLATRASNIEAEIYDTRDNPEDYGDSVSLLLRDIQQMWLVNEGTPGEDVFFEHAATAIHRVAQALATSQFTASKEDYDTIFDNLVSELGDGVSTVPGFRSSLKERSPSFDPTFTVNNEEFQFEDVFHRTESGDRFINTSRLIVAGTEYANQTYGNRRLQAPELDAELQLSLNARAGLVSGRLNLMKKAEELGVSRGDAEKIKTAWQQALTSWSEQDRAYPDFSSGYDALSSLFEFYLKENGVFKPEDDTGHRELYFFLKAPILNDIGIKALVDARGQLQADIDSKGGIEGALDRGLFERNIKAISDSFKKDHEDGHIVRVSGAGDPELYSFEIPQTPYEIALEASSGEEDWIQWVSGQVGDIGNLRPLPYNQQVSLLVNAIDNLLLNPESPGYQVMIENPELRERRISAAITHIANRGGADINAEKAKDISRLYIEQYYADVSDESRNNTRDRLQRELLSTVVQLSGLRFNPVQQVNQGLLTEPFQNLESLFDRKGVFGDAENPTKVQKVIDTLVDALGYDMTMSFLAHTKGMKNISVYDIQEFTKAYDFEFSYTTTGGRGGVRRREELSFTYKHNEDDPEHHANRYLVRFGQERNGMPVAKSVDFRDLNGDNGLIALHFAELSGDPRLGQDGRARLEEVKTLLSLDFNVIADQGVPIIAEAEEDPDNYESYARQMATLIADQIMPKPEEGEDVQAYTQRSIEESLPIARLLLSSFSRNGLDYKGLVGLQLYIENDETQSTTRANAYRDLKLNPMIREGELRFGIVDNRKDAAGRGFPDREVNLPYGSRASSPYSAIPYVTETQQRKRNQAEESLLFRFLFGTP